MLQEPITVLGSQPAGDRSHKPGGRLTSLPTPTRSYGTVGKVVSRLVAHPHFQWLIMLFNADGFIWCLIRYPLLSRLAGVLVVINYCLRIACILNFWWDNSEWLSTRILTTVWRHRPSNEPHHQEEEREMTAENDSWRCVWFYLIPAS